MENGIACGKHMCRCMIFCTLQWRLNLQIRRLISGFKSTDNDAECWHIERRAKTVWMFAWALTARCQRVWAREYLAHTSALERFAWKAIGKWFNADLFKKDSSAVISDSVRQLSLNWILSTNVFVQNFNILTIMQIWWWYPASFQVMPLYHK